MAEKLTIGRLARRTGVSVPTVRFYESEGLLPPPERTEAGYRLYDPIDVRRLRLIRRARLLGLALSDIKTLVTQAFASECVDFADQLLARIATQRTEIERRMTELAALREELDTLEAHIRHDQARAKPGQRVAECAYCPLIDEEGGD